MARILIIGWSQVQVLQGPPTSTSANGLWAGDRPTLWVLVGGHTRWVAGAPRLSDGRHSLRPHPQTHRVVPHWPQAVRSRAQQWGCHASRTRGAGGRVGVRSRYASWPATGATPSRETPTGQIIWHPPFTCPARARAKTLVPAGPQTSTHLIPHAPPDTIDTAARG